MANVNQDGKGALRWPLLQGFSKMASQNKAILLWSADCRTFIGSRARGLKLKVLTLAAPCVICRLLYTCTMLSCVQLYYAASLVF